jgi:hypothetical protein
MHLHLKLILGHTQHGRSFWSVYDQEGAFGPHKAAQHIYSMLCDAPKWLGDHLGEQARVYGKTQPSPS